MRATALLAVTLVVAAGCSSARSPKGFGGVAPTTPATNSSGTTPPTHQPPLADAPTTSPPASATWSTYQVTTDRWGVAPGPAPLTPLHLAWRNGLDGAAVYGQPLMVNGKVVVATEDDDLYALDARTGTIDWHVSLGAPLQNAPSAAGCGDIDPLGITSTPVIDAAAGVVYAVGEVSNHGSPPVRHEMVAVDLAGGRVLRTNDVDPPLPAGENPIHLLQRASLALGNRRVYAGYGGQYGDCGTYHGWLVAAPTVGDAPTAGSATTSTAFDVTPSSTGGAIWQSGAAPAIGAGGPLYVTSGNPNSGGPAPWSDAALELGPDLGASPLAAFQDRAATGDLDLGTGAPVLLPNGEVFVAGKTETGFVLRQSDLALQATIRGTVCGSDPDGGSAFDAGLDTLYVPCHDGGIQEIDLARGATGWKAGHANSTPVLAGGRLWALEYPGGTLQELDPSDGTVLYSTSVGAEVPTFASLSVVGGLVLVPTRQGVAAFAGSG